MRRRSFITGLAAAFAAPALVRASSLEYVPRGVLLKPSTGRYVVFRVGRAQTLPLAIEMAHDHWQSGHSGDITIGINGEFPVLDLSGLCNAKAKQGARINIRSAGLA